MPYFLLEHGRTVFGRVLGNHVYFQMEWKHGNLTCKADGKDFAGKPSYHKTYAQCPRWPKDSRNHTITLELNGKTVSTTEEEAIDEGTITNHVPATSGNNLYTSWCTQLYNNPIMFSIYHLSLFIELYSECEGNKRTKLDIGFVMDVSGSISKDDWKKEKMIAKQIAGLTSYGTDGTQVGVVTFDSNAKLGIKISDHTTKSSFENSLE